MSQAIPQRESFPPPERREYPKPLVESATRVSPNHPDRNEDKILGVADEKLPVLAGEDPEGDKAALSEAIEKEARCAEALRELDVYGVLDGVSTGAGALGSRMASSEIAGRMALLKEVEDANPDMTTEERVRETERAVAEALDAAQKAVMEYKNDPGRSLFREDLKGMGTTADVVRIVDDKAVIGHIGDGAVYRVRDGKLERLTRDHSASGFLKEQYGVSDREYETLKLADKEDPSWSDGMKELFKRKGMFKQLDRMVYASIGSDSEDSKPDVFTADLEPGDRLLVCSDGVTDNWTQEDMESSLAEGKTAKEFLDATMDRMTKVDDVSLQMIEYPEIMEADIEEEGGAEITPQVVDTLRTQTEESGRKLAAIKGDIESDDPDRLAVHGGKEAALAKWQAATREYLRRKEMYLESAVDLASRATGMDLSADRTRAEQDIATAAAEAYIWSEVARLADIGAEPSQAKGEVSEEAGAKYAEMVAQGTGFDDIGERARAESRASQEKATATENLVTAGAQLEQTRRQMEDFEKTVTEMNRGRLEDAREEIMEISEEDMFDMEDDKDNAA